MAAPEPPALMSPGEPHCGGWGCPGSHAIIKWWCERKNWAESLPCLRTTGEDRNSKVCVLVESAGPAVTMKLWTPPTLWLALGEPEVWLAQGEGWHRHRRVWVWGHCRGVWHHRGDLPWACCSVWTFQAVQSPLWRLILSLVHWKPQSLDS